jgi:spermidine synthase
MNAKVVFDGDTDLDHYVVVDEIYNDRPSRVLYSKGRIAAQSGIALDDNSELLFDYNERFMELIRGLVPKNILVVGGGAFTLPTAVQKEFPDIELDVVEIDAGLVDIAREHFGFVPSKSARAHIGDGADILDKLKSTYDMIILDVYEQTNIPERFQTPELIRKVNSRLNENGIVAMNIIAAMYGIRSSVLHRIVKGMEASFLEVEVSPAGKESSLWIAQNFVLTAHHLPLDIEEHLMYKPVMISARKPENDAEE